MKRSIVCLYIIICYAYQSYTQGIYQLWGIAPYGGTSGQGVLYSTDQYGNKFTVRKSFTSDFTGANPWIVKLVEYGGKMYGVTNKGGTFGLGVVFRFDPISHHYDLIHSFNGTDGSNPYDGMTASGNKLYGMTYFGGVNNKGVIYEVDTSTLSYTKKYDLSISTGSNPYTKFVEFNGILYAPTYLNGTNNLGTIISYNPANNIFSKLFDFSSQTVSQAYGNFCIYNNKLYGVAYAGGSNNNGGIYVFDPSNNSVSILYNFTAHNNSYRGMINFNNLLYGIYGGNVYSFDPTTNSFTLKYAFTQYAPPNELSIYNNRIFGLSPNGTSGDGAIVEYDPVADNVIKRADFHNDSTGSSPTGALIPFNNKLYCLTYSGGFDGVGVCDEFDPTNNSLVKEFEFNDPSTEGEEPVGGVTFLGTKLYGSTHWGGQLGGGCLYSYDLLTNQFSQRNSFGTDGYNPYGRMNFYNGKFYGTTSSGGLNFGTIFDFDTLSGSKTTRFNFPNTGGGLPTGSLTAYNDTLYGFAAYPIKFSPATNTNTIINSTIGVGQYGNGFTEFAGNLYALLYNGGDNGDIDEYITATGQMVVKINGSGSFNFPHGSFTKVNNKLYANFLNSLIEYDPIANTKTTKYTLNSSNGQYCFSDLTAVGNRLYGLARDGGAYGFGTLYEYNLNTNTFTKKIDFNATNGANNDGTNATTFICRLESVPAVVSGGTPGTCLNLSPITIDNSNNNEWVAFTGDKGEAIAEINANGNNLGAVNVSLFVNNGPIRSDGNNNLFLDRNIYITSSNAPSSPVGIRFYIKESEVDSLIAAPGSGVSSINDIKVFKSSNSCQSAIPNSVDSIHSIVNTWINGYVFTDTVNNFSSYYFASKNYIPCSIPSQPGSISGSNSVCQGSSQTYSISAVSGATSYSWTLPSGWTGSSTTTSITATVGANSGNISVTANNNCGSSTPRTLAVTVNSNPAQPGTISGNATVCQGSSQTYSISSVSGATSYIWTLPSGWTGSSTTTSITVTVGANSGNVSVAASNSCGSSSPRTLAVTVNSTPSQPGTISGNTTVCQGSSQTYSISAVSGATSYTWTLPSGWTGSSSTTSITATVGANSGNISVIANNSCGSSTPQTLAVTVNATPAQPGSISGNNSVCQGISQTYSISSVNGATSYTWTLPSGWTGSSTTTSITTTVGAISGNVSVTANNSCGSSTPQNLAVTVNATPAQPGTISGSNSVCQGNSQTYSISSVSGATSYTWTLPSGWTGSSTTTSITATVGASSGNISVTANNNCGSSTPRTLAVTVNTIPAQPGTISGSNSVCQGSSQTYSISSVSGATSYSWTLPSGWTGSSTITSITATVGANSGNVSVTANNSCGSSTAQTLAINVNTAPSQPGTITGNIMVNVGQNLNYLISAVNGATGYTWSLSGGGTITSGQNTTSVSINWTTIGNYTLSVNANNNCGTSNNQTLNITVSISTGVNDPNNPFEIKIGPNPSSGDFYLMAKGVINKVIRIEIIDLYGQTIYSEQQTAGTNNYSHLLNLNKVAAGVYEVKIFIDKKIYLRTIVKIN